MEKPDAWHMTDQLNVEHGKGDPFAAAIRATRMSMIITDPRQPDNPIVFCNDAFLALTGYQREEVLGRNCRFLQGEDTDPQSVEKLRAAIAGNGDVSIDILNYRKDGTTFWNALYISPVVNEAGELLYFFASQLDVTDRKNAALRIEAQKDRFEREVERRTSELRLALQDKESANQALEHALEAKTALLHEVDHRVKNNLQMIASLIMIQTRNIKDAGVRKSLQSMLERVEALGTVHRRLYQSDDVTRFDISDFTRDLVSELVGASGRDIHVNFALDPVDIAAERAAPLALVINEIATNALKHAFPDDRAGKIDVSVQRHGEDVVIGIADDGIGLPADPTPPVSFGRSLIRILSRQLRAGIDASDARPGTRFEIRLPVE